MLIFRKLFLDRFVACPRVWNWKPASRGKLLQCEAKGSSTPQSENPCPANLSSPINNANKKSNSNTFWVSWTLCIRSKENEIIASNPEPVSHLLRRRLKQRNEVIISNVEMINYAMKFVSSSQMKCWGDFPPSARLSHKISWLMDWENN